VVEERSDDTTGNSCPPSPMPEASQPAVSCQAIDLSQVLTFGFDPDFDPDFDFDFEFLSV